MASISAWKRSKIGSLALFLDSGPKPCQHVDIVGRANGIYKRSHATQAHGQILVVPQECHKTPHASRLSRHLPLLESTRVHICNGLLKEPDVTFHKGWDEPVIHGGQDSQCLLARNWGIAIKERGLIVPGILVPTRQKEVNKPLTRKLQSHADRREARRQAGR